MLLPQYVIYLGSRAQGRKPANAEGKFDREDMQVVEEIVRGQHGFSGSTIALATGYHEGQQEDTMQISILEKDLAKVEACARQLKDLFRQHSVLITHAGVGEFMT